MPNNKFDSKSFNAEAFKYMVARVPNLNMNEIKKSRALAANPDIQEVFSGQNGTAYARLAMRGLIDGDAVNYDGSTDITATSTKTFEQGVVVVGRAKAWKERDFSYDVTGGVDFMANISEQVAQYKDELDEATILSILKGIFAMPTTDAKNKEFVEKHTTTVSGAMTATTLNTAANKACGANKKKFTLVFCHSDVSTGLENLNLIERLKYTDKDGIQRDLELGTWNGKLVIVTDQMPVSEGYFDADANTDGALKIVASGTPADGEILLSKVTPYFGSKTLAANDYVVAGVQYTTYAMGNGAFSYEDIGVKVPYEMARDPKTNGGEDLLYIQPIIMGIVAAMLIYNGVALATNIIMGIQATAKAVHAAATAMEAGATFTATVAQQGLNAALLACPLTWIILLIIAVIAAIYAACAAVAKFTGIANSGFGVICGGIMVVIAFFKNLGLSVANIALGIWNALGACASNIGTAFHNVISNVQGWFYNLLSTALTVVAGICEALNKLPFVEFDYSGITNKASEYAAKSAEAYGNVEEYKSVADAFNEGMSTFDTFQDGWAADAFASGAAWGDGVADKVSGMFDFSALDSMGADSLDAFNLGNDLDSIYGNTGDIANNTAATADALDIAEEDLAYLRDIAEREAINRFTTAEIKVEQHNENHISSEMDIDGIMDAWTENFAERLAVSAEGVHK